MSKADKRVALVTGGCRGIGFGISQCLAAAGFNVATNGRRPEHQVAAALSKLQSSGAATLYHSADVGELREHAALLDAIRKRFGRLDVLVNNAGIAPEVRMDLLDATPESFDRVMRVNLRGPYFLTQRAARWMIEQKRCEPAFECAIINISSISATVASVQRGEYCISKAGVAMATQLWAARLGEFGIPVYEVRPGVIRTDMTAAVAEKYDRLIAGGLTVEPRWGEPEDVGRAVAMLATGNLPYATGNALLVDGGLTLQRL